MSLSSQFGIDANDIRDRSQDIKSSDLRDDVIQSIILEVEQLFFIRSRKRDWKSDDNNYHAARGAIIDGATAKTLWSLGDPANRAGALWGNFEKTADFVQEFGRVSQVQRMVFRG